MPQFTDIYFNFFSIGALLPTVFVLSASIFFLLLRDASPPTRFLGLWCLLLTIFNFAYFLAGAVYHPVAAYHRFLTVGTILPLEAFITFTFFLFPKERAIKAGKILLAIQMVLAIGVAAYFIIGSSGVGKVYHFDGHYWDLDADSLSTRVGVIVLLYGLIFLGTGVWRLIVAEPAERLAVTGVLIGIGLVTLVPAIFNILTRIGYLERDTYQISWDLFSVMGSFVYLVTYLNYTKDRTTFMAKIVGVGIVTFLLVFQMVAYVSFADKEEAYDLDRAQQTARFFESGVVSKDLKYAVSYRPGEKEFRVLNGDPQKLPDHNRLIPEWMNTYLIERINSGSEEVGSDLGYIASTSALSPYTMLLKRLTGENPSLTPAQATEELRRASSAIEVQRRKVLKTTTPEAIATLRKNLENASGNFRDFAEYLKSYPKAELQDVVGEINLASARRYRKAASDASVHYVAFQYVDLSTGTIGEVGYDYRTFREFIHPTGLRLTVILGMLVFVGIGLLPLFFRVALTKPLKSLLDGVQRVNHGDLNVDIPVQVEDEIGLLSRTFNRMVQSIRIQRHRLQEYAENLELKVQERTSELQNSLEEIQSLKSQQDGDYFLTSLLTTPMSTNQVDSEKVRVDFLIDQKKKFEFKHWQKEIGGDACMAHTIELRGKRYVVFLNADAMGKSMQGAGGVIVLGSVFRTIIDRTRYTREIAERPPEKWLKSSFVEMHRTFENFDGSMLVSVAMGLLDEETGFLYYLNAEHPYTILYRDGKAQFLEDDIHLRKLGTTGLKGKIKVQTFAMRQGDVLILGSDGRDDLIIGEREDGSNIFNEDEQLILHRVEESKSDLKKLYERLVAFGKLSDDLSLLRVGWMEHQEAIADRRAISDQILTLLKEARFSVKKGDLDWALRDLERAYKLDNTVPDVLRELIRVTAKMRSFDVAVKYSEEYIRLRPHDTEVLYYAGYCAKMANMIDLAIDLAESVRLREPEMLKNLYNLADLYVMTANWRRAEKVVATLEDQDEPNEALQLLQAAIKSAAKSGTE